MGKGPLAANEDNENQSRMISNYNKKLTPSAQQLRKTMTPEEKHLWYDFLKKLPVTVNRQKTIGNYIVDFFISSRSIVIEVDGIQHETPEAKEKDILRDADLGKLGITVLRYKNSDVNRDFNCVCNDILKKLGLEVTDIPQ